MPTALSAALALLLVAGDGGTAPASSDTAKIGHSIHGAAFDEGPREAPWRMEGIGRSHFPITTGNPEVQEWFDQGHTLLHSFWYYEAERAFRHCLKLDPDCAMAYWGLARSVRDGGKRSADLLKEAVRRKDRVSRRERLYIEAWERAYLPPPSVEVKEDGGASERRDRELIEDLERIAIEFPDDVEAKALLALRNLSGGSRLANDLLLREILAKSPDHPGAHHYTIHNWDGPDGVRSLASCAAYGRVAPAIGHANHMPGHVYSGVGMWHEAAIWMDSATRVELRYMRERLALPHQSWNYAHNRNYLAYIQEQLGRAGLAIAGARDLLAAPLDPKENDPDAADYSVHREGLKALFRALVKFERWDDILKPGTIPWRKTLEDRLYRAHVEALAHIGKADVVAARADLAALKELRDEIESTKENARYRRLHDALWREAQGLVEIRSGDVLGGLARLAEAAERELEIREDDNDPPDYPRLVYDALGEEYLALGIPSLAIGAFEKALAAVPNDGPALAGLARASAAAGDREKAAALLGRLRHLTEGADPGVPWIARAEALGIAAEPRDEAPEPQRLYRPESLDALGPARYEPFAAPALAALDSTSRPVSLEEYRGKNVLLVFYIGDTCPHCVDQLVAISKRSGEFASRRTAIVAVSSQSPESLASSEKLGGGQVAARLLSDPAHANARAYRAYDDFEDRELHATVLVDAEGKLRFRRSGGEPFMDLDFLLAEIDRVNGAEEGRGPAGAPPPAAPRASGAR